MTWTQLAPFTRGHTASGVRLHALAMSSSKPGGRVQPMNILTLRTGVWPDAMPPWLVPGGRVNIELGSAEHRFQLRLVPGAGFVIGRFPGKPPVLRLNFPLLPGQAPGAQRPFPCDFDWQDDWVSFELPPWARPSPAIPQPALSPAAQAGVARKPNGHGVNP